MSMNRREFLQVMAVAAAGGMSLHSDIALAEKGTRRALEDDPHLLAGLNVARGRITCASVAEAHGLPYHAAAGVLAQL